jgi:hypothetical protein
MSKHAGIALASQLTSGFSFSLPLWAHPLFYPVSDGFLSAKYHNKLLQSFVRCEMKKADNTIHSFWKSRTEISASFSLIRVMHSAKAPNNHTHFHHRLWLRMIVTTKASSCVLRSFAIMERSHWKTVGEHRFSSEE